MDRSTENQWENLCRKCGLCCFEKIETGGGTVFYTQTPCRYLDVVSRECTIYDRRFEIYRECVKLTPELVRELHWLHPECGYKEALAGEEVRGEGPRGRKRRRRR
jgi:uncharacterized protein